VRGRIDPRPRLRDDGLATYLDARGRRTQREPRPAEDDAAAARRRIDALAALADETGTAVGVVLARLGAADEAVAARGGRRGADALDAGRARVAAREAGLPALLARVDAAVAALEELALVGAEIEAGADGAWSALEIRRRRAGRRAGVDRRARVEEMEVAPR